MFLECGVEALQGTLLHSRKSNTLEQRQSEQTLSNLSKKLFFLFIPRGNIIILALGVLCGATQVVLRLLMAHMRSMSGKALSSAQSTTTSSSSSASPPPPPIPSSSSVTTNRGLLLLSLLAAANIALVPVALFGFPEAQG